MKAIIIVGATGVGKSTLARSFIKRARQSRVKVYDVNGEYYPKGTPLPPIKIFLQEISGMRNTVVLFEEATVFFSNRGSNEIMKQLLVGKRHDNNFYILIFHSIRAIPFYIYDLVNFVAVFHTADERDLVESKHPLLLQAYLKVHRKKYKYKLVRIS